MRKILILLLIFAPLFAHASYVLFGASVEAPIAIAWNYDKKVAVILADEPCVFRGEAREGWARAVFAAEGHRPIEGCFTQDPKSGALKLAAFVPGRAEPLVGEVDADLFSKVIVS